MKKFYIIVAQLFLLLGIFFSNIASAQLTATFTGYESRCASTGAIKIVASGGSGSYQFKVEGPVTINYTDQDSITGLSPGYYKVFVNDIISSATLVQDSFLVSGSYADPRFSLDHVDVSCDNGFNGSISISGLLLNGRPPFVFSIVAPSPMGVGTTNLNGVFTGLQAGNYSIQMTDSCGGIQTRNVTLNNYAWNIDTHNFTKLDCDHASGYITIKDSKGNDSKYTSIPGFTYGASRAPGDTIWSVDGNFNNIIITGIPSIDVFAKDACGNIKKVTQVLKLVPSIDANVTLNKLCNSFSVSVTGIKNFFGADFYLFDNGGTQIDHNTTGTFNNFPYGNYCITAHDGCTDSTIQRCFNATPPVVSVSNSIKISNKTCVDFTASVTGQTNLTSPQYCLINSSTGTTISCNSSGVFTNVPTDGNYCITIKDGCIDTAITRCFSVSRPIPKIDQVISPVYITCTNFGLNVGGDSLTNPTYCLYDINNNPIGSCNNTGKFDSIPLGSYYVTIHDQCRDTTIRRDITVNAPTIANDVSVSLSNRNCTTFTATAKSNNLKNASFCLFTASDSTQVTCNTSGVFNGLAYGEYYIKSRNGCPDTTMVTSFSAARILPSVNPNVKITNKNCTTFSAQITGQKNLITPTYCLINADTNDTLGCSTSATANGIPYGSYIISIVSGCNDTLRIPFSQYPDPLSMTVTASKSCTLGQTQFNISVNGVLPVNIKIYNPQNNLVRDSDFNVSNFIIDNLPALDSTDKYTVIGTDGCGKKDTLYVAPKISYLQHTPSVLSKCPGSVWLNGSGNINTTILTNLSSISVMIIFKNGTTQSPDYTSGSDYAFNDLGPSTYVINYHSNDGCNVDVYDTITISSYVYPNLNNTTAYQCDVNGFSVSAVTSGGVAPFTYQIIGNEPATPDLSGPPQSSPTFNINNGSTYSLVRLRALDACGNATLKDFPILPLDNNGIQSTSKCLLTPATLSVDSIYNASYSWFHKTTIDATDSSEVSNNFKYDIPSILPTDTGFYICKIEVNGGCINRTYSYHLYDSCSQVLAPTLQNFVGEFEKDNAILKWKLNNNGFTQIIVERKAINNDNFTEIGEVNAHLPSESSEYRFIDKKPVIQNFYRLKIITNDNTYYYSNIILLQKQSVPGISIYPNPADDLLNIDFLNTNNHTYQISLSNILNQKVKEIIFNTENGNKLQIKRSGNMSGGIYILQFIDLDTKEVFSRKVIFNNR